MVTIELRDDDALVLFEYLSRNDDKLDIPSDGERTSFQTEDPSEYWAVIQLLGALERTLVAPFLPDYTALLAAARREVRIRNGLDGQ